MEPILLSTLLKIKKNNGMLLDQMLSSKEIGIKVALSTWLHKTYDFPKLNQAVLHEELDLKRKILTETAKYNGHAWIQFLHMEYHWFDKFGNSDTHAYEHAHTQILGLERNRKISNVLIHNLWTSLSLDMYLSH